MSKYEDGQLLHLSPAELKDMKLGGNIRRKVRPNWSEFVESVRQQGVLQSVIVRLMPDGTLELLAGYGRRDAAIEVGLEEIPSLIRICDDATALQIHLSENTDRADLTFSDQVVWAKRFISIYNGDVASSASRLNWSESKLRERLSLVTCAEQVLDALDAGKITVKHALILAAFEEKIQINTLTKVVAEKWSVNDLKARADRVQIALSQAVFDKAECNQCIHNTQLQAGLFGMGDSGALCSKSSCFHNKTKAALTDAKSAAEERFGTVLWLSQSMPEHRQTVTPLVVGESQFTTGCMGCEKRVAVMDDAPYGNPGSVMESQCTDKACFAECTNSFDAFNKAQQTQAVTTGTADNSQESAGSAAETDKNVTTIATAKSAKTSKSPAATNSGAISQVLVETHWKELRDAGGKRLAGDRKFSLVMQLLGVMAISKFKAIGDPAQKMATLFSFDEAKLEKMINDVVTHCATAATTIDGYDACKVITSATVALDDGMDVLISAWVPTEQTLKKYTTTGLEQIIKLSGLDAHCESKEKGAGKKISAGRKGDVIKQILAVSDFDWTGFAPPAYTSLMESFTKQSKAA